MIKYPLKELPTPKHTKLNLQEKIERIPIELFTFLDDPEAKIKIIDDNSLLIVESDLSYDEIENAIFKCLTGLDFSTELNVIRSTF